MDIIIKSLTPNLLDDFLYYFDKVGFADNPEWGGCYCRFYHFEGSIKKWGKRTNEENRQASIELINAGKMNGLLAYVDDKPIGWCNINPRCNFTKELYKYDSRESQSKKIAGIVCFLIAHTHRKKGIARELLRHAIEDYKSKEYDIIESYPRIGELSEAHSYRGPVSLYKSEGFEIYKKLKDFWVMRKYL
ncbi:MAG: GNAT family N-acetyltransferase [Promethearchaeota archaeon]|jgi:GNAT superfamily N-acetyltransferase